MQVQIRRIIVNNLLYTLKHVSPYLSLISKCYGIFIDDHEDDNEDDDMLGWVGVGHTGRFLAGL